MSKAPTLFDFDDFPSEEERSIKPPDKENGGTPASGNPVAENTPGSEMKATTQQVAEPPGEQEDAGHQEPTIDPGQSFAAQVGEQYIKPGPELPGKEALTGVLSSEGNDDLDKQLLQELATAASFAGSKYPFDLASVEVIEKEKPVQKSAIALSQETEEPEEEQEGAANPLPEWNLNKNYYSIGEVAQLFGVNISHIRFWTTEFKMKPRTTRKGDRLYTPVQIAQLRLIYHLVKEKKHTLKGAMEILKSRKDNVARHLDLKESLTRLRNMLQEVKESL